MGLGQKPSDGLRWLNTGAVGFSGTKNGDMVLTNVDWKMS